MAENDSTYWLQFGNALFAQERFAEASDAYRRSTDFDPRNSLAWRNLGSVEHILGRTAEARSAYVTSLTIAPEESDTKVKLALLHESERNYGAAELLIQQVVAQHPAHAEAWGLLGRLCLEAGKQPEATQALRRSVALQPNPSTHSRLLQSLQYVAGITPQALLDEHRRWAELFGKHAIVDRAPSRGAEGKLSIAFLSADLGFNPVGYLVLPLLKNLDKAQCSVTCYFDGRVEDGLTSQFKAAADQWRPTCRLSDEALSALIRQDQIDVLIDLMGHVGRRLTLLAKKPAPLQITWFGYVGTTGVPAVDFLLADRYHVRSDDEPFYVERILRMPNGYACYDPLDGVPDVGPLPAQTNGYITFCCFNNPAKYSTACLDSFADVLRRVPTARLLLKFAGLQEATTQQRFADEFSARGVSSDRIVFEGWSPHAELMASYHRADIALDTQPYSGGLTTCEALWMGVPVITFPGQTFAGRHANSYLTNAGYPQFVARDATEYVQLAFDWASRLNELAGTRANMRSTIAKSTVCDAKRFAEDFLNSICGAIAQFNQPSL